MAPHRADARRACRWSAAWRDRHSDRHRSCRRPSDTQLTDREIGVVAELDLDPSVPSRPPARKSPLIETCGCVGLAILASSRRLSSVAAPAARLLPSRRTCACGRSSGPPTVTFAAGRPANLLPSSLRPVADWRHGVERRHDLRVAGSKRPLAERSAPPPLRDKPSSTSTPSSPRRADPLIVRVRQPRHHHRYPRLQFVERPLDLCGDEVRGLLFGNGGQVQSAGDRMTEHAGQRPQIGDRCATCPLDQHTPRFAIGRRRRRRPRAVHREMRQFGVLPSGAAWPLTDQVRSRLTFCVTPGKVRPLITPCAATVMRADVSVRSQAIVRSDEPRSGRRRIAASSARYLKRRFGGGAGPRCPIG